MNSTAKTVAYGILVVVAAIFAVKTFLYGGSKFDDPNDSPLYKSTLDRAVDNFKESDYVLSRDGAPKGSQYGAATAAYPQQGQAAQGDAASQYLQAGIQFLQQSKFKEAITYLEAAAQMSPNNATIHTYLGTAYDKLGDKDKSRQAYQKAALLRKPLPQPGSQTQKVGQPQTAPGTKPPAAKTEAAQSMEAGMAKYREGSFQEAVSQFEAAIKANPQNQAAYSMLGNCYFALRDNDKMIASYEAATKAMPTDAESFYNLGIANTHLGNADKARQAFQKAIELNPKHTHAHAGLGRLLQDQGKPEEAMKEFQYEIDFCKEVIKQKPNDAATCNRLAHFYLQHNINVQEGVELADKATTLMPDEPNYLATAAQLYLKSGNKEKAIELIDKALQKTPDSAYFQAVKRNITAPPKAVKPQETPGTAEPAKTEAPRGQAAPAAEKTDQAK